MGFSARSLVQRASASVESLPAPVGGWNVRDSLANMEPMDAVTMVNMFPTVSSAVLRGGYSQHATGLDGATHAVGDVAVTAPDTGAEAVEGVVGNGKRIVEILEACDGDHRPEDFFLKDPHFVVAFEDGGLHVIA